MADNKMSLNWIKITERAREGIKIINSLENDIFCTVLDYVHKNMSPNEEDHDESENSLEELEKLIGVKRNEFLLLIKTLSYILKRTSTFIIKPTKLQIELNDKLELNQDKIDIIMKLWIKNTKTILNNLNDTTTATAAANQLNELNDITWKLKYQFSSNCQQKEKTILAQLQFKKSDGNVIDLEMNHNELTNLYYQLENIQNELDALKSK